MSIDRYAYAGFHIRTIGGFIPDDPEDFRLVLTNDEPWTRNNDEDGRPIEYWVPHGDVEPEWATAVCVSDCDHAAVQIDPDPGPGPFEQAFEAEIASMRVAGCEVEVVLGLVVWFN